MSERRITLRSRVVTAADVKADPKLKEDSYLAKVVRYIPGEVVAAYLAAAGAINAAQGIPQRLVHWIAAIVLTVITPFWTLFATRVPDKPLPVFQAVAATISFIVWVFTIGGPFVGEPWYNQLYGSLLLIFCTLIIPILEKVFVRGKGK